MKSGVNSTQLDRQVLVVYTSLSPMELWVECRQPGVPEEDLFSSDFCNKEPHFFVNLVGVDVEVDIVHDHSCLVGGVVYIVKLLWGGETSCPQLHLSYELGVYEIVGGPTVH